MSLDPAEHKADFVAEYVIALDVGGSSVKSAIVRRAAIRAHRQGEIPDEIPVTVTPLHSQGEAEAIFATFAGIIRQHRDEGGAAGCRGVAVGFPGPFDYEAGICRVHGQEKFDALYGLNVGDAIRRHLGDPALRINFRNDADVAITGEAVFGEGTGYTRVIGVTLGTGLGSSFIVAGVPQTGGEGVPPNGELWAFPAFPGARPDQRADDIYSIRGLLARLRGADPAVSDIPAAHRAALAGDLPLRAAFAAFGEDLAAFLSPFVVGFRAEVVLLLGGIANAHPLFAEAMRRVLPCPVLPGGLGQRAALLGATYLLTGW
jgi:glucokinase